GGRADQGDLSGNRRGEWRGRSARRIPGGNLVPGPGAGKGTGAPCPFRLRGGTSMGLEPGPVTEEESGDEEHDRGGPVEDAGCGRHAPDSGGAAPLRPPSAPARAGCGGAAAPEERPGAPGG